MSVHENYLRRELLEKDPELLRKLEASSNKAATGNPSHGNGKVKEDPPDPMRSFVAGMVRNYSDGEAPAIAETEIELVRDFASAVRGTIAFLADEGRWVWWDGKVWRRETSNSHVRQYAQGFVRSLYALISMCNDEKEQKRLCRLVRSYNNRKTTENLLVLATAAGLLGIKMQQRGELFNLQNGCLNLETMELLSHSPELGQQRISPVSYDPQADCPRFKRFLEEIFEANQEIIGHPNRKRDEV